MVVPTRWSRAARYEEKVSTMGEQVTIEGRFRGPPDSGNGGYVCGRVAAFVRGGDAVEVTLRRPPPLDRPLDVGARADGTVALLDSAELVAIGAPVALDLDVPPPVAPAEAREASARYPYLEGHPMATCFVCGPARADGDGLRLFAGPVAGRDVVATPWRPYDWLAGPDGAVREEFVWAALDCPGGMASASLLAAELAAKPDIAAVLGRQGARLLGPLRAGEPLVVMGWPLGREGRRLHVGSAVLSERGEVRAVAKATWVILG